MFSLGTCPVNTDKVAALDDLRISCNFTPPSGSSSLLSSPTSVPEIGSSTRWPHVSHVSLLLRLVPSSPIIWKLEGDPSDDVVDLSGVGSELVDTGRLVEIAALSSSPSEAGGESTCGMG